jgi:hypothetical protein
MQLLRKGAPTEKHLKRSIELQASYAAYTNLGPLYYPGEASGGVVSNDAEEMLPQCVLWPPLKGAVTHCKQGLA